MRKSLCLFFLLLAGVACNQNEKQINTEKNSIKTEETKTQNKDLGSMFVSRSDDGFEKVFLSYKDADMMEIGEIYYQTQDDAQPIKLNILKIDEENMQLLTEKSDDKTKMTFSKDWTMAGTRKLSDNSSLTFYPEVSCVSADGQIITTAGGPMFMPFFYAPNAKTTLKQANILNVDGIPDTGEDGNLFVDVSLPNKKGKYKIIMLPYEENNSMTKLVLINEKGNKTAFEGK